MPQLSISERKFRAAGTSKKALVSASSGFVEAYVGPGLLTCSLCGGLQAALFPAGGVFPDIHLRVQRSPEGGHDVSSHSHLFGGIHLISVLFCEIVELYGAGYKENDLH